ncbi:MAG: ECF-type sigma factor [Steroidobacteraceae bacterium]
MVEDASLTDLIRRARGGDASALQSIFESTYDELRGMARNRLRQGNRDALLDTTALVHECFIRFANSRRLAAGDRIHFFRYAGRAMRSVIVDMARAALAERRGGGAANLPMSTTIGESIAAGEEEIVRIHEALDDLARFDGRLVQVVEMRYFAGMTETQVAEALGVTDRTIRRDWEKARLLLARSLSP